jgi:hypothetical protein
MPRKQRRAKTRTLTSLTPAAHHLLMIGSPCAGRIKGWVALGECQDVDAFVIDAWDEHGDQLAAEAAAAGFVPWAAHRRPPTAAARRWSAAFAEAHRY